MSVDRSSTVEQYQLESQHKSDKTFIFKTEKWAHVQTHRDTHNKKNVFPRCFGFIFTWIRCDSDSTNNETESRWNLINSRIFIIFISIRDQFTRFLFPF